MYALALFNQRTYLGFRDPNNSNLVYNFVPNNSRGFAGRAGYDYKSKYLFELDGAYNGTDAFSAGKRFGFFPSASAGYNISEEPFFKNNIKFVDRLKFRGSYGLVGSDQIGNYQYAYTQTYNTSGNANFGASSNNYAAIYEGRLGNNDVTWEKEKKLNIGVELSMFKGKVTSTVDLFNNNRYDILTTRGTVSAIFGQALPPVNLGKTNNRGFEVEAAYNDNIGKDFTFRIGGNISVAKNKIVFQDEPQALNAYQLYTGNPIGTPLQYKYLGFYTAADIADPKVAKPTTSVKAGDLKYADLNGDGIITAFDQSYFGSPNLPNTVFGFNFNANYKNFALTVFFQGAVNFNVAGVRESIQAFGSNLQQIHLQSWTPELGDNAKYPILSYTPNAISNPTTPSDFWNVRGDYIRLKSVEFSYALPQKWMNKVHLKAARIYTNGTNLITWTKLSSLYGYDPEIATNGTTTNYPPQRLYNMGLSVTF
ncbi:MAG: SusC/RagA family TonB-linked outer membrane protein [Sphingobacteriaceae bacterium]|nr:MAG: SusC/RagA family TonB-linked outer membrane protein [Sphingobacteriaceae bacterium]